MIDGQLQIADTATKLWSNMVMMMVMVMVMAMWWWWCGDGDWWWWCGHHIMKLKTNALISNVSYSHIISFQSFLSNVSSSVHKACFPVWPPFKWTFQSISPQMYIVALFPLQRTFFLNPASPHKRFSPATWNRAFEMFWCNTRLRSWTTRYQNMWTFCQRPHKMQSKKVPIKWREKTQRKY